jgi:GT2 family glycosyltransferase
MLRGRAKTRKENVEDLTIVVVNFESGNRLEPLLNSIEDESAAIAVVDNASGDGSERAALGRRKVSLMRNQSNRGFAAAANQGAKGADSEWIVFVNPDTRPKPGQISQLVAGAPSDAALMAPLQVAASGRPISETGGYEPALVRFLVWAFLPGRFHGRHGPWLAPPFPEDDTALDWVSGALLAARSEVFERLGGFDERFFLFQEDVDLSRRVRAAGYRVLVRPAIRVPHEVGQSGDPDRTRVRARAFVSALSQDFPGLKRRLLGLLLTIGFGWRSLALGSRGAMARAAVGSSFQLLATGRSAGVHR